MNKFEINNHINNAYKHYSNKLEAEKAKIAKILKRTPKANVCKSYILDWKQERQKYIAINENWFGYNAYSLYAIVDVGKNVWIYSPLSDPTDTMDARSIHFFKRYAERTNQPFLFPAIVAKYQSRNVHRFKIYDSDDKMDTVYACREGIEICRWDKARGITKFCTFVSFGMLGETQKEAWKVVQHKIDEADDIVSGHYSIFEKIVRMQQWSDSSIDVVELATSIYKQYYNEIEQDN